VTTVSPPQFLNNGRREQRQILLLVRAVRRELKILTQIIPPDLA